MKNNYRKEWLISTLACTGLALSLDTTLNMNYNVNNSTNKEIDDSYIEDVFGLKEKYSDNFFYGSKIQIEDDNLYSIMPAYKYETENGETVYYAKDGYVLEGDKAKKLVLKMK